MSKEIYISSTPHETRLAIVESDDLTEIYYERENEYTLAGSIYNGKVTRVLPGMQSSFVDIGLERDAFLYITDFMEEAGDAADFESTDASNRANGRARGREDRGGNSAEDSRGLTDGNAAPEDASIRTEENSGNRSDRGDRSDRGERSDRSDRRDRGRRSGNRDDRSSSRDNRDDRSGNRANGQPTTFATAPIVPARPDPLPPPALLDSEPSADIGEGSPGADGSRRWRGRRGRRRGRGPREEQGPTPGTIAFPETFGSDSGFEDEAFDLNASQSLLAQPTPHPLSTQNVPIPPASSQPIAQPIAAQNIPIPALPSQPLASQPSISQPAISQPPAPESRDRSPESRGRGGRDRDRSSRDRAPRAPRGFAPRSSLYGVDATPEPEETLSGAPEPEPIILPGESLSKYRKDAAGNTVVAPTPVQAATAPSTEFHLPGTWDGGAATAVTVMTATPIATPVLSKSAPTSAMPQMQVTRQASDPPPPPRPSATTPPRPTPQPPLSIMTPMAPASPPVLSPSRK